MSIGDNVQQSYEGPSDEIEPIPAWATDATLLDNFLASIERAGHGQTISIADALRLVNEIRRMRQNMGWMQTVADGALHGCCSHKDALETIIQGHL